MRAVERRLKGWACPKGLITYVFEDQSFKALAEIGLSSSQEYLGFLTVCGRYVR